MRKMENLFDYAKIKEKVYDKYSHTIFSLSKKCDIPSSTLYNFFDVERKHNAFKDMYIILKIANGLHIEIDELIA